VSSQDNTYAVIGPVNLFLHSLFSQVDISLNGTQAPQQSTDELEADRRTVFTSTNTYPYRTMIETLLSYDADAKAYQLTSSLFYADDADRMHSIDFAAANRNSGLCERSRFISQSRPLDTLGRIHADMFFQDRYLLN